MSGIIEGGLDARAKANEQTAADLMAWRAKSALHREVTSVTEDKRNEMVDLLAAGALTMMLERVGTQETLIFLDAFLTVVEVQQATEKKRELAA